MLITESDLGGSVGEAWLAEMEHRAVEALDIV